MQHGGPKFHISALESFIMKVSTNLVGHAYWPQHVNAKTLGTASTSISMIKGSFSFAPDPSRTCFALIYFCFALLHDELHCFAVLCYFPCLFVVLFLPHLVSSFPPHLIYFHLSICACIPAMYLCKFQSIYLSYTIFSVQNGGDFIKRFLNLYQYTARSIRLSTQSLKLQTS
jgi:hypothetical protein